MAYHWRRGMVSAVIALVILSRLRTYQWLHEDPYTSLESDKAAGTQTRLNHETNAPVWVPHNVEGRTRRLIPSKIWQILLSKDRWSWSQDIQSEILQDTSSWLAMNPDFTYTLVGETGGKSFFEYYMPHRQDLIELYNNLPNVGMRSDFLRYLVLYAEGGVYTDTDTVALKPIDQWVPHHLRDRVRLVVGIEFDRRDGPAWADIPHWLQFCQWTIAAAPGHVVFEKMFERISQSLRDMSDRHRVSFLHLKPSSFEVMNSTGPAAWTDIVFQQLQEYDPTLKDTKDLSFMSEPKLYGDILVLTIDGFGMGQMHSDSTNDGTIPQTALVRHLFHGSWRTLEPENGDEDEADTENEHEGSDDEEFEKDSVRESEDEVAVEESEEEAAVKGSEEEAAVKESEEEADGTKSDE